MKTSIRPLTGGDLERVGTLVEANEMFPASLLPDMTAAFLAGETAAQRWIVFDQDRVEGVAYYCREQLTDGTWNLLLIAVDPERHGTGIGSALIRYVESELRGEGQRILLVETSGTAPFERTRSFYEMLGFEREARIRDYYSAGDDKVVFRKALA